MFPAFHESAFGIPDSTKVQLTQQVSGPIVDPHASKSSAHRPRLSVLWQARRRDRGEVSGPCAVLVSGLQSPLDRRTGGTAVL